MTRYPRQVDREYLSYCPGGLHKIKMIDCGTLDLHQDLVACDRRHWYIVEYQLTTIFQSSDSVHTSSPFLRILIRQFTGRSRFAGCPVDPTSRFLTGNS